MSAASLQEMPDQAIERIAAEDRVFCFLDYDGTLAPFAPTPDAALPLPGIVALLQELTAAPGTRVAIVSGRPIAELRRFIDLPAAYYIGLHGLEVSVPDAAPQLAEGVGVLRAILPAIRRRMRMALGARPGILIEDKGAALACHYRHASAADAVTARQTLASVVRAYQRRGLPITVEYGHEVAEIRTVHANKGKTVCALLATHAPTALPIYIGDRRTNADAFMVLPPHSIAVEVGPDSEPPPGRYRLSTPDEVHRFLRAVLDARSRRG